MKASLKEDGKLCKTCKTCLREIKEIYKKENNWYYCSKLCYNFL